MLCCGEIMQNLWAVEASHALHFGTQRSVQPAWEPGASSFRSTQTPACAVSGGNPVTTFPSNLLKLCDVCSAAYSKGVGMAGFFKDVPVNLVFLRGLGVQCVKFGFQTPAWFHSYPYDQQMELREYYFLEAKEIVSPWFS